VKDPLWNKDSVNSSVGGSDSRVSPGVEMRRIQRKGGRFQGKGGRFGMRQDKRNRATPPGHVEGRMQKHHPTT